MTIPATWAGRRGRGEVHVAVVVACRRGPGSPAALRGVGRGAGAAGPRPGPAGGAEAAAVAPLGVALCWSPAPWPRPWSPARSWPWWTAWGRRPRRSPSRSRRPSLASLNAAISKRRGVPGRALQAARPGRGGPVRALRAADPGPVPGPRALGAARPGRQRHLPGRGVPAADPDPQPRVGLRHRGLRADLRHPGLGRGAAAAGQGRLGRRRRPVPGERDPRCPSTTRRPRPRSGWTTSASAPSRPARSTASRRSCAAASRSARSATCAASATRSATRPSWPGCTRSAGTTTTARPPWPGSCSGPGSCPGADLRAAIFGRGRDAPRDFSYRHEPFLDAYGDCRLDPPATVPGLPLPVQGLRRQRAALPGWRPATTPCCRRSRPSRP